MCVWFFLDLDACPPRTCRPVGNGSLPSSPQGEKTGPRMFPVPTCSQVHRQTGVFRVSNRKLSFPASTLPRCLAMLLPIPVSPGEPNRSHPNSFEFISPAESRRKPGKGIPPSGGCPPGLVSRASRGGCVEKPCKRLRFPKPSGSGKTCLEP